MSKLELSASFVRAQTLLVVTQVIEEFDEFHYDTCKCSECRHVVNNHDVVDREATKKELLEQIVEAVKEGGEEGGGESPEVERLRGVITRNKAGFERMKDTLVVARKDRDIYKQCWEQAKEKAKQGGLGDSFDRLFDFGPKNPFQR